MDESALEQFKETLNTPGSFLIHSAHLSYPQGLFIEYRRGGRTGQGETPSAIYDTIEIRATNPQASQEGFPPLQRLNLISIIQKRTGPGPYAVGVEKAKGLSELEGLYRATTLKLEAAFADQIRKITSWTVEQAEALEARKLHLAEETASERRKLLEEHETRSIALNSREAELEKKRLELDDRDHMHARRATRADIQKQIERREKQFQLTRETRLIRRPIHIALGSLIYGLAIMNVYLLTQIAQGGESIQWLLIKQSISIIALVAVVLYYVRWMNRWFQDHAAAEFNVKQFQLDVDRASWAIEASLEWQRQNEGELPKPLLDGLTRNLFSPADHSKEPTAVDDLASAILGSASQLRLRLGDSEMELDRRALSRLRKKTLRRLDHVPGRTPRFERPIAWSNPRSPLL